MDIIWHLGAHRTGTTSTQRMMQRDQRWLRARGVVVWGPRLTRSGEMRGLMGPLTPRGWGRDGMAAVSATQVRAHVAMLRMQGVARLVISDENMLGGIEGCLAQGALYPDAAARLVRLARLIGPPDRLHLTVRSQRGWWRSALAYLLVLGRPAPGRALLGQIAASRRGWADLVDDIRQALPGTAVHVATTRAPQATFRAICDLPAPGRAPHAAASPGPQTLIRSLQGTGDALPPWLTPDRFQPFERTLRRKMLQTYRLDRLRLAASAHAGEIVLREGRLSRQDRQGGAAPWPMEPSQPATRTGPAWPQAS